LIINVPALTEERRRELAKRAKAECENMKVTVRNHRKDALDMVKELKNDGLSEDMAKDAEGEVQIITDAYVKKIDALFELKEKDIMTI
jgi:ribosome recycling factor